MQNVFPVLTETPGAVRWSGPTLGQHNKEIYEDLLRLSEAEIAGLQSKNVI
jgi:crotonobetainyl-CoA:carnitine CoA-transferase CaiB-like acyl-CoA transferase